MCGHGCLWAQLLNDELPYPYPYPPLPLALALPLAYTVCGCIFFSMSSWACLRNSPGQGAG